MKRINTMEMSASKLECLRQLRQSIHNLKMTWPSGWKTIDDENKERLKTLEQILKDVYGINNALEN